MVLFKGNYYLSYYLKFLRGEIPNIIQIFGFPSLLGFVLKNEFISLIVPFLILLLLVSYLGEKLETYMTNQLLDAYSFKNLHHLKNEEIYKRGKEYAVIFAAIIAFIAVALGWIYSR